MNTRTIKKAVGAALLATIVSLGSTNDAGATGTPAPVSAQVNNLTLRVGQVVSFTQLKGQPAWTPAARSRFANSTWVFRSDGTFTYAPTDSRSDLFPLSGRYTRTGNTLRFNASRTSTIGSTGRAGAAIQGTLTINGNRSTVSFVQASGMGNVAIVNNTKFSGSTSSAYRAVGTLVAA